MSRVWMAAAILAVLVTACASTGTAGEGAPDAGGATGTVSGELIVFAAASLTDASEELREAFVAANPDVEVRFNHAGSQTLASQLDAGAPADVFASADATQMARVAGGRGLADGAETFATNTLAIAVEVGNPLGLQGLEDLDDPDVVLVLPAEEVPAGEYAREALEAAGVEVAPASLEQDVRAALAKVELGEADAAIVYASDLAGSSRAEAVELPDARNVTASYPIAVLAQASNPSAADAFVAFVRSDRGQEILATHGFGPP